MATPTGSAEDINPAIFLSADELISLRKPRDVPMPECISEKYYIPEESHKSIITSLFEDQKKMLGQKSVARIGDLIQAEWKPELKKAVTTKLKGKAKHIGTALADGKIGLAPEEAIFLLESGHLEIRFNNVPLCTESAYTKILSDDLAIEKYKVYSHLSRLGYIVVQHQKDVDLVQKEKLHAMNKCQCTRKRKRLEVNTSNKKILSTNGISVDQRATSPCGLPSEASIAHSPSHLSVENSCSESQQKKLDAAKVCEETSTLVNSSKSSSIEQVQRVPNLTAVDSDVKATEDLEANIAPTVDSDEKSICVEDKTKSSVHLEDTAVNPNTVASTIADVQSSKYVVVCLENSSADANGHSEMVDEIVCDQLIQKDKEIETELNIVSESLVQSSERTIDEDIILECSESENTNDQTHKTPHNEVSNINGGDEIHTKNGTSDVTCDSDRHQNILVADITEDEENDHVKTVTKPPVNVFRIDDDSSKDSDASSSDVLYVGVNDDNFEESGSSQSCEETNEDSVQSVNETAEAEDVMVLQVNRKEPELVAVINLSSDEEVGEKEASDDDEVLIIKVCSNSQPSCLEQRWFPPGSKLKREGGNNDVTLLKVEKGDQKALFPFPMLFRKRVLCLPRPPSLLMPFNASLSKEAYTIDLNLLMGPNNYRPSPRLWNSYKDLQQNMHNFKNDAGFNSDYPRGFASSSSRPNANFNPLSSESSSFQNNNFPPPNNNRFDMPVDNRNFSSHMDQAPPFSSSPMLPPNRQFSAPCSVLPNRPPLNGSPFPMGNVAIRSPMGNMAIRSPIGHLAIRSPIMQEPFNIIEEATNPWNHTRRCDDGFQPSPSSWQNLEQDHNVPPTVIPWNTPPQNEGYRSNPWMEPPQIESYRSSPNSCSSFRGQSNFQNNLPFQEPRENFSNPWMSNWQSSSLQNDPFFGNRHDFQQQHPMNRRNFSENPYPCDIPKISVNISSWGDLKSSTQADTDTNAEENDGDDNDIQEVAIDVDEVLWSKEIRPLLRPGTNMPISDVLKTLQITTMANLSESSGVHERFLPDTCNLQISFDVYLPATAYKKSCPSVPSHRIVVTRSRDPFPKLCDVTMLLRKLKDPALLLFAVVDDGSIAFYSLSNVNLPVLLPHQ